MRTVADQRYRESAKGRATMARAKGRQQRRNAHLCARPGCGHVVVTKRHGRVAQLCRRCCVCIRMSIRFGDQDGRTLPGLGVVE